MRLIASFEEEAKAFALYEQLMSQKIEAVYEPIKNSVGVVTGYDVWVVSEDEFELALNIYEDFLKNNQTPHGMRSNSFQKEDQPKGSPLFQKIKIQPLSHPLMRIRSLAPLTRFLIAVCVFLFFWTSVEQVNMLKKSPSLGQNAFFTPLTGSLLYDYPLRYKKLVKFFEDHPNLSLKELSKWNIKERSQYAMILKTPVWEGYFDAIAGIRDRKQIENAPKFTKIFEGEYWRVVTPIFLHGNFLHILFNMLWLFLLGRELEIKIGKYRLISLIAVLAVLTNTAQYLMSGPLFLGFSGVICGLGGFIWVREKCAPWEGYSVPKGTLGFLFLFVIGMMALQGIALVFAKMELGKFSVSNLGNTAHVSGLVLGCLMAKIPVFYRLRQ